MYKVGISVVFVPNIAEHLFWHYRL